jgi:type 1 glutamine amidotransferase
MKKILLVTDGIVHPPLLGRMVLHKTLKRLDGASFVHVSSLEKLSFDLSSFSALVLHYHHKTITDATLKRLQDFVSRGGGILAIHAATASFKETLPYFEILGGRFIGHGPVEEFEVRRVSDSIFGGMDHFVVRDELYIHELQPGIEVHFAAKHNGEDVPVIWTHRFGNGNVCYAVPGHTTGSMRNTTYQKILQRGLRWACRKTSSDVDT